MINRKPRGLRRRRETESCDLFSQNEPETWTIITALDRVLELTQGSELDEEFWKEVERPISFLTEQLELTRIQVVFLAILVETGESMSWRKFGNFLNCSRLSVMVYTEEIEGLVAKRWLIRKGTKEITGNFEGYSLSYGVITALRHNQKFVPEKIDGLTEQEFVDMLERHLDQTLSDHHIEFRDVEAWMQTLCEANPHLPLCHDALQFEDIHALSLLLLCVYDYAQWEGSESEGLCLSSIDDTYPPDYECNGIRRRLQDGSHRLLRNGYLENKCEDGLADIERFMLTEETKTGLLSAYTPSHTRVIVQRKETNNLKSFTKIQEKELFFNPKEQEQVDRLTSLLSQESLPSIQQRLEDQGMRKGFACLFYGGPGTGKTETVLQIARKTGRNIMQIDIAGLRDKWVGESEKNIKKVFSNYRELCKNSEVMPILFFNEADGIINKRTENISHSVDKMDNAMQNIILQEIEDLDGILIATTNLTSNLDSAFERRFLFKIEFNKPEPSVKAKIWSSMLKNISDDDARTLASKFDFSGGQIENIARKRTIDFILSGEFADIEAIEGYCRNELLENKKTCKPVMGFRA